ncbi:UNVERIFIED_CONTAM: hypothetical protein FKN15_032345 [Acipenser sinensis]
MRTNYRSHQLGSFQCSEQGIPLSISILVSELDKHRSSLASELTANFKSLLTAIQSALDAIRLTIDSYGQRLNSMEHSLSDKGDRISTLEAICATLAADNESFKAKLDDLEHHSRRQNLRIIGLPESMDSQQPVKFISDFFIEVLVSEAIGTPPKLDRAHCSLCQRPGQGEQPRALTVRFHCYQTK